MNNKPERGFIGTLGCLVGGLIACKRIRLGPRIWGHWYRWVYLPWGWAYKRTGFGGWIFLSRNTPGELLYGYQGFWRRKTGLTRTANNAVSGGAGAPYTPRAGSPIQSGGEK
jgi:hypothetical protein